jgi:hypothetical protein
MDPLPGRIEVRTTPSRDKGQFFDYIHLPCRLPPSKGGDAEAEMLFSRRESREPEAMERRDAPRLDKVFRVYLEGERGMGLGIARNISEGGMFVETRSPQPIGSQVRITFPSDSGEMSAVGEVRYVCHLIGQTAAPERGPLALRGMGVRFLYFEVDEAAPADVH